jgi:hypothetical protein
MKAQYIDHYGIDSLPHLRKAAEMHCAMFVTTNQEMLDDRKELEVLFNIKIRTPEEMDNELQGKDDV